MADQFIDEEANTESFEEDPLPDTPDLGPNSAGQSGDTQGLLDHADSNSQSVLEFLEEGQYYEASVVSGIENVLPADEAEVTTKEVSQDDVPAEYSDEAEFRK